MADETNDFAEEQETAVGGEEQQPADTKPLKQEVSDPDDSDVYDDVEDDAEAENDEEGEGQDDEESSEDSEAELIEVEFNGRRYKVHPDLKDGVLMQADYTRKTQANAEKMRALEEREKQIEQRSQFTEQELDARASLRSVEQQIKQYEGVNWQALENEDPLSAQSHWRQYQQLRDLKGQLSEFLTTTDKKRSEEAQQATVKRLQETREFAEKNIKGWSLDLDNKIAQFAMEEIGLNRDTLVEAYNPQIYKTLYLAYVGQQSLKRQASKPKPVTTQAKPLEKVAAKGGTAAKKSLSEMSMEEYAAYRNQQERRRAQR